MENFEDEFNDFFGSDSLFKRIGAERAKKIFEIIKTLKEKGDVDGIRMFTISDPFSYSVPMREMEEPIQPEITKGWENGNYVIKKIWRDKEGRIIDMEIKIVSEDEMDGKENNKIDFNDFNVSFKMPDDFPPMNFLPMIQMPDFKSALFGDKPKVRRSLQELLEAIVEVEDYDMAAIVRDIIKKNDEFQESFWDKLDEAKNKKDVASVKTLMGMYDRQVEEVNEIIDKNQKYFKN